jgi:hypothetical protein
MSGDAGAVVNGTERSQEASQLLDSFERCPSEHAKTVFILDELVPWIQGKRKPLSLRCICVHQMRQLHLSIQFLIL